MDHLGKKEHDASQWLLLDALLARLPLSPFTLPETTEYLTRKGIAETNAIEAIHHATAGLPLMVATFAMSQTSQDPTAVANEISVENILASIQDVALRAIILDVGVCRWFNLDVLKEVVGFSGVSLFDALRQQPFVVSNHDGWAIHPALWLTMIRELSRRSPERLEEVRLKLAAYHDGIAGRTFSAEQHLGARGRWGKNFLESGYHHLCLDPAVILPVAIHKFLDALQGEQLFASLLAGSIRDAGTDAGHGEVQLWGERMENCLRSLVEIDPPGVGEFMSQVLGYPLLIPDYRAELVSERAWNYLIRNEFEHALADAEASLALNPDILRAHSARGHVLRKLGRSDEALAEFRYTFARDNARSWDHASIGYTYLHTAREVEAVEEFSVALSADPEAIYIRQARGEAYFALGKFDEAIADLTRAIEGIESILNQRPGNILEAHYHGDSRQVPYVRALRGIAYALQENADMALGDLNFSLRFLPDFTPALSARGNALALKGRREEALEDHRQAIALDTNKGLWTLHRAHSYWTLGEYENALADYSRVLELEPENGTAYLWRSKCHIILWGVKTPSNTIAPDLGLPLGRR